MSTNPYSHLKILWHLDKLQDLKSGRITSPIYIRIKPTNRCNHRCFYCSYADKELKLRESVKSFDEMPWKTLKGVILDLASMGVKAVTFSGGGEPLSYPFIEDAFRLVLKKKIELSLITNGQLLLGKVADLLCSAKWVRISMDSCDPEVFARTRGISKKSFDIIASNIKKFSKKKNKSCELGINFVVTHENANQVYDMAKFVKGLGVNHIKYTARITKNLFRYHAPFKDSVIKQIHKAQKCFEGSRFKIINKYEDDFSLSMKLKRTYSFCPMVQVLSVVAADSKVYLCHDKAYVPGGAIGDLKKKTFKEIWLSPKTKKLFQSFDPKKECRHHCVYDERNIFINELIGDPDDHINFI
ncbi:MAG: radical SAM protein [Candidatus Omnitrophica bacterium]|nr:radical SAM protein [Candidatus Omnitrophota bacterium]